ncbi:MAG: hypothetical protein VB031_05935 [Eubacteriaceae bacterium]|nr:hypothetical protein [Eubacteriaceae bacterium]
MDIKEIEEFIRYDTSIMHNNKHIVGYFVGLILLSAGGLIFYCYTPIIVLSVLSFALAVISTIIYKIKIKKDKKIILFYNSMFAITFIVPIFNMCLRMVVQEQFMTIFVYILSFTLLMIISILITIEITKKRIFAGKYYKEEKKETSVKTWGIACICYVGVTLIVRAMSNWIEILTYTMMICCTILCILSTLMLMRYYYAKKYKLDEYVRIKYRE